MIIVSARTDRTRKLRDKYSDFGANDKKSASDEDIKQSVLGELRKNFKPEFLNRVDDIIVFKKLTDKDIEQIAYNMLETLCKRTKDLGIEIKISDEAVKKIAKEGFDEVYGARPLRRAITSQIEDLLSELMLEGKISEGDTATLNVKDDKFVFDKQ